MIMMMDGHDICEQTPAASGDEDVIIIRVLLMNYVYSSCMSAWIIMGLSMGHKIHSFRLNKSFSLPMT